MPSLGYSLCWPGHKRREALAPEALSSQLTFFICSLKLARSLASRGPCARGFVCPTRCLDLLIKVGAVTCVARPCARGFVCPTRCLDLLIKVGVLTCVARLCARCFVCPTHVLTPGQRRCQTPPGRRRYQTPPLPTGVPDTPQAGGGAKHPPTGGGAKCLFYLWRWRSSVNATLILSSISQPHLSQTVRCGTSRQLATDTCDGGFVQTLPFPTRLGSLLTRVCASGPLRDWETARRNSPADLKHTQPPSRKQDRPDETRKTVMHLTQQSSRHSTVPRLAPVCPTRLCVSLSVVLPCHVTRGIIQCQVRAA